MGSSVSNPASCNRQNDKSAGAAERVLSALWRHICGFETLPETCTLLYVDSTWRDGKQINWEGKSEIAQEGMGTRERKQQVDFIKKLSEPRLPVQSAQALAPAATGASVRPNQKHQRPQISGR